ncbi:MAG: glutathione S-transferase family protein [Rickettsiales bacterium]|nr:glutathione S-transferase family protein [Rickettsiales bacterium]
MPQPQYQLYYAQGASSLSIHALLCSIGASYELTRIDIRKHPLPKELFEQNPRGQIPVLIDNERDVIMRESMNIALYLCETHKSPLLPTETNARYQVIEWLAFLSSNLHQSYASYILMQKQLRHPEAQKEACLVAAKRISYLWKQINTHLTGRNYLVGESITIADVFHTVIANWTSIIPNTVTLGEETVRLCKSVIQEPFMQQAMKAEDLTYQITE